MRNAYDCITIGGGPAGSTVAALVADLMGVLLKKRARENRIATAYLGNSKAVSALVTYLSGRRDGDTPPLLTGWRKELVGEELVALFEGKMSLRVNPDERRIETLDNPSE